MSDEMLSVVGVLSGSSAPCGFELLPRSLAIALVESRFKDEELLD